jgi:hypothetical protein
MCGGRRRSTGPSLFLCGASRAAAHELCSYKFAFDGVFDERADQSTVFDLVAREAVDSALGGFNATIFAVGRKMRIFGWGDGC